MLTGDWDAAMAWLESLEGRAYQRLLEVTNQFLDDVVAEAKREVMANEIQPPSKKAGITLVDTTQYVEHFGRFQGRKAGGEFSHNYAGLPPSGTHGPSGVPWDTIYRWLRYGTARMPPRPHIDTAFRRLLPTLPARFRAAGFRA